MNLRTETLEILKENGRSVADILWVGTEKDEIPVADFLQLSDVEYNSGYGSPKVAQDLVVVMRDGSWLERGEYDGSEWWEFRQTPIRPALKRIDAKRLTVEGTDHIGWCSLRELNEWEVER